MATLTILLRRGSDPEMSLGPTASFYRLLLFALSMSWTQLLDVDRGYGGVVVVTFGWVLTRWPVCAAFVVNAVLYGHINTAEVANIGQRIFVENDKVSQLANLD